MMLRKIEKWTSKHGIYHSFIELTFIEHLLCTGQRESSEEQSRGWSVKNSQTKIKKFISDMTLL